MEAFTIVLKATEIIANAKGYFSDPMPEGHI